MNIHDVCSMSVTPNHYLTVNSTAENTWFVYSLNTVISRSTEVRQNEDDYGDD